MTLGQTILRSCRDLQRSWTRLADSAYGRAAPAAHDEMSRGEFISAFISERDLNFPTPRGKPDHFNG